jgi:hypothetical protein
MDGYRGKVYPQLGKCLGFPACSLDTTDWDSSSLGWHNDMWIVNRCSELRNSCWWASHNYIVQAIYFYSWANPAKLPNRQERTRGKRAMFLVPFAAVVFEDPVLLHVTDILSILTSYSEGLHNGHPARSSLVPEANVGIIHQTASRQLLPTYCRMFLYTV